MKEWTFKIFGEKKSDVDDWIKDLSSKVRAKMDTIIAHMEITKDWTRTAYFSPLKGHRKIHEIRFTFQSIQYRPLGCYGPGNKEFTILIGAIEQGDRFKPINAPLIAENRRNDIRDGREQTHEYN
jgi:hypothetical protein